MVLFDISVSNVSTVLFFGTVLMLVVGIIIMIVIFYVQQTAQRGELKAQIKKLEIHFKEEILNAQIDIQEKTMRNISLEIHDNVGQLLTLAKLNLSTIDNYHDAIQENKIADARDLISKSIGDLRALSKVLGTDMVENGGLVGGVQLLLDTIERCGIIKTNFHFDRSTVSLDIEEQLVLFRIVQESLTNVIKHSRATEVSVHISENNGLVSLTIKDNGIGINAAAKVTGSGISHMRRRAKMMGAQLNITTTPPQGTSVSLSIAIQKRVN